MNSHFSVSTPVAILTKHAKEALLAPLICDAFGVELIHTDKFDTDSLGTFDNKIARRLSPQDAALKKAYLACELTCCEQGIGSEGSFNSVFPVGTLNEEYLAFVNPGLNIEVVARASSLTALGLLKANSRDELAEKLQRNSLEQRWMIKQDSHYVKGLSFEEVLAQADTDLKFPVELEADFRAMHCPDRQLVIKEACKDLIARLTHHCPQCGQVDFVADEAVKGLPCELCHLPSNETKHYLARCKACAFESIAYPQNKLASSFNCPFCNP
jgi:hypothetical protein